MARAARFLLKAFCILLLAVLVIVGAAFGLLQTRAGKDFVAGRLTAALSTPGQEIRIGRISGLVPFDFAVDEVTLSDREGVYAALRDFRFDLAAAALLDRRLRIRALTAAELEVMRAPAPSEAAPPPSPGPPSLPQVPHLPLAVELDRLAVETITLDPPVLGEAVALTLGGSATLAGGEAAAQLALRRTDAGGAGGATLDLRLGGTPPTLHLALDATEPSGLLLAKLLGRDDRPPLTARLAGEGPLADWRGTLTASAGDLAQLSAKLRLAVERGTALSVEGKLAAAPLLPPAIAPLVGDELPFSLAAEQQPDGSLALQQLSVDLAAAQLAGSGSWRATPDELAGHFSLKLPELGRFEALAGAELAGTAGLVVDLAGSSARPVASLVLDAEDLRYGAEHAKSVTARLRASTSAAVDDPAMRVRLVGDGRLAGLASDDAPVPKELGQEITWQLDGSADRAANHVELQELVVSGGGLDIAAQGTAEEKGKVLNGTARLEAELSRLADWVGKPLAGKLVLDAVANGNGESGAMTLHLSGSGNDLATGFPAADALLGGRLSLAADARRGEDGALAVETLKLEGDNLSVGGHGETGAAADAPLRADLGVSVPRLAPLAAALGRKGSGALRLEATASGTRSSPALAVGLSAKDVSYESQRIDALSAKLDVEGLEAPAGRIDANLRAAQLKATLGGDFRLSQNRTLLEIPTLRLAGNGTSLEAALRVALDRALAAGTVNAKIPDLAPWSALAGMQLRGRANLKAVLDDQSGQSLDLDADAANIEAKSNGNEVFGLTRLDLSAHLKDLLGTPAGKTQATIAALHAGPAELRSLKLRAGTAKGGGYDFDATLDGKLQEPLSLTLAGDAALAGDALDLRVSRLSGAFAGTRFALRRALKLHRKGDDFGFEDLALTLGGGEISGSAALRGAVIAAQLTAKRLPLALAGKAAGTEVAGTLGLDLALSGTVERPQGRLVVEGQELRLLSERHADAPPLTLSAEAKLAGDRAELRGRVNAGKSAAAVGFSGSVPIALSRAPFSARLPPNGALSFRLEGDGELGDLAGLLPLGEDRVTGHFHLDMTANGTIAAPVASGVVTLARGRYENLAMGTIVSDVSLEIAGNNDRLVLRRFSAHDGGKGELAAEGGVVLSATPGPAFDLRTTLRRFEAVRRDDATAFVSGEARIAGTVAEPQVAARLRVDEAELRVPDSTPAAAKKLDVIRINSRTGRVLSRPEEAARAPAISAALDIAVELPGRVFVRGRGLESEWRGRVTVTGTTIEPIIVGRLESVRGTFALLGKSFQLTQSVIGLDGGQKVDPTLDIQAQATASGLTAIVQIGGTASAPTLKLTSDPPLPQDEVLAQLLFGKGVGQITPAQGVQLAAAAASLASGGPGILDRLRGKLGLDRLDIGSAQNGTNATSGSSSQGGLGNTTVSAGKYVTEGVYVGVDQSVSGQSRAKVEVEVTPHISVETDVGGQNGSGVGVNWKLDY